jgi:hypothetical protein
MIHFLINQPEVNSFPLSSFNFDFLVRLNDQTILHSHQKDHLTYEDIGEVVSITYPLVLIMQVLT